MPNILLAFFWLLLHIKKKSDYYYKFRVDHYYSGGRFQDYSVNLWSFHFEEREEQWKGSERSNTNVQKHRLTSTQETAVGPRGKVTGMRAAVRRLLPMRRGGQSQQMENKQ